MDWAYDNADPAHLMAKDGPYSLDADHYRPMCRRCHQDEDRRS
jgi:hypothetical protein